MKVIYSLFRRDGIDETIPNPRRRSHWDEYLVLHWVPKNFFFSMNFFFKKRAILNYLN